MLLWSYLTDLSHLIYHHHLSDSVSMWTVNVCAQHVRQARWCEWGTKQRAKKQSACHTNITASIFHFHGLQHVDSSVGVMIAIWRALKSTKWPAVPVQTGLWPVNVPHFWPILPNHGWEHRHGGHEIVKPETKKIEPEYKQIDLYIYIVSIYHIYHIYIYTRY